MERLTLKHNEEHLELIVALQRHMGVPTHNKKPVTVIEHEIADEFITLVRLIKHFGLNLEEIVKAKLNEDKDRVYINV